MLTNIMYVTLYVTDQERSLRFYTEQLGLEKRIDHPGPGGRFLTVGVPGAPLEIILWPQSGAAGQPVGTPGPVFLESDDLRADFTVLRDRGVTFDQPEPEDYGLPVVSMCSMTSGRLSSLRVARAVVAHRGDAL